MILSVDLSIGIMEEPKNQECILPLEHEIEPWKFVPSKIHHFKAQNQYDTTYLQENTVDFLKILHK